MSFGRVFAAGLVLAGILVAAVSVSADTLQMGDGTPLPLQGTFTSPVWRPDGQGIALSGDNSRGLYYTDLSGNMTTISHSPFAGWKFRWSPDGANLVYRAGQEEGMGLALMVAGTDGQSNQVTPYMNDMSTPEWGKDGITYRSGDELVTADKSGNVTKVSSLSQGRGLLSKAVSISASFALGHLTGTTFSALGAMLSTQAARSKPGKGAFVDPDNQIWVVDQNGNSKKLIDVEGEHGYFNPIESPGGNYAVSGMGGNLYLADPRGVSPVSLGVGNNPTWSPDGKFLIFERSVDDGHEIISSDLWYASADGTTIGRLTETPGIEESPAWSPDGSRIAYTIDGVVYIAPISR